MKWNLSPAYSLKLKNIILFLNRGSIFIFYKWSYSQRCFNVTQHSKNLRWKWRCFDYVWRCSNKRWFDVVKRFKFQRWHMQRCFNIDLTLHDVAKSYQPKNNVETTLKCLLGFLIATFNSIAIHYIFFWKS